VGSNGFGTRTFWTTPIDDSDVAVQFAAGKAEMRVDNLSLGDYGTLANATGADFEEHEDPAVVSFDVVWSRPITRQVHVPDGTLGNNYAGDYVENQVTVTWSGTNLTTGFSFTSDPGTLASSSFDGGFAELGHERNGTFFPDGDPVLASANPQHPLRQVLTPQQLQPVLRDAIAAWRAAGASPAQLAALSQAPVHIAALPIRYLGEEAGGQVWISPNADGWGWSTGAAPARGRMDLPSVVTHELGHVLGLGDSTNSRDVMGEALSPGVRRLPTASDLGGTARAALSDALLVRALGPAGAPALGGGPVQPAPSGRGMDAAAMVPPADIGRAVQLVPAPAVLTAGPGRPGVRDRVFADLDGGFAAALGTFAVPAWPL